MDIDLPQDYDFKFGPVQDLVPVRFPYNPSAWITQSEQSSGQAEFAGRLSLLPLDIFWNMLDECLLGNGDLTLQHDAFHSLLSLSQVDFRANKYVEEYVARRKPQQFLRRELGDLETFPFNQGDNGQNWYPGHVSDFPIKATDDFLGRVIEADCPTCFAYLLAYLGIDIDYCNKSGWSFAALAIAYRSVKILEYMLHHPGSLNPLLVLLLGPANINFPHPTAIGMLGHCGERDFLGKVLDLIEIPLANLRLLSVVSGAFSAEDLCELCKYISPHQAQRLQALGVSIAVFCDPALQINPWHGAVFNGTDFLDFLHIACPFVPNQFKNEEISPLRLAVANNRLDVVQWFKKYGYANNVSQEYNRDSELTVAMRQTSGESACIVWELLPIQPGTYISSLCAGELLQHMVLALHEKEVEMRRSLGDEDYNFWRLVSEGIAIEKCKTVLAYSSVNDPARVYSHPASEAEVELTINHHKQAREIATFLRFNDLAQWIWPI